MPTEWWNWKRQRSASATSAQLLIPMAKKVWWAFGVALALLALIGITAYTEVVKLRKNDALVDHTHQVISSLRKVQSLVADAETGQRGYIITGEKTFLRPYTDALNELDGELATLRALVADNPKQQDKRETLESLVARRLEQLREVLQLREAKGMTAAAQVILSREGSRTDSAIRETVKVMEQREDQLLVEREQKALRTSFISRGVIVLGSLLAFGFVGVAMFLIYQDFAGTRRAQAELQEAKDHLEHRVQERTVDLAMSNDQLRISREQYAVTLASIGDAVITTDAHCRVTFLNPEAERLTGWKRQEVMGQPLVSVFQILNEETRESMADPARKVLELDRTVGLANHTLLITKNGQEIPIADSGAPIRDASGKVLGVVLVFRDCTAERETEAALRERVALQTQLAQVAEASPGAICSFLLRPDGSACFPYCNPAIAQIYDVPIERLAEDAAPAFQAMHPEDRQKVRGAVEESARTMTMWVCDFRVNHPRKGEIWVEGRSMPQRQADGSTLWHGILQDVTERRLAGEKIKAGEMRLSAIIDSALDGVITVDEQQKIILFNPAAEQIFGWSQSEALGRSLDEFIPERFREAHRKHLLNFGDTEIAGRKMGQRDGIFGTRKNGQEFPLQASISHVMFGGKRIYTVILRDVTEEKKAEQGLKQQASLLDLAPVMVRDMEDRIVLWSRGAEKIYGYSKEEALGRISNELLQTEFPFPMGIINQFLRTNGVWEGELHQRTREGVSVYVASEWVLYREANGEPARVIEVDADITARRHVEELQTRSQKLEALGTLAGGIAHDFNNILLAINGNAQLAMADVPPEHPVQQSLAEIHKAGTRASELVRRILGFSRPQKQKKEAGNLQPVVEEALKLVRATIPARIQIVTHFASEVPAAKVDAGQIHQVIVNLATNAAHAIGEKNGTIEVRLDAVNVSADDTTGVADLQEGRYVRLYVGDDGCGMDRATQNRIFDPFFTTKKLGEGTGLGLSVVHGIVSSHNGAIAVTSQPGKGTAFHVYFPIAQEQAEKEAEEPKPSSLQRSEHVLYVDDEEALVFLATRLLERRGYQVSGYTDAAEALENFRARAQDFDVVVTDLSMPRMSGFELTEAIHATRPDIPVVLTSGYLQSEDQQKAERLGIRELIQKPATADRLAGTLERILTEMPARIQSASH